MKNYVIRADAGGALGSGHVMRMIALAQSLVERGGNVTFLSVSCPETIQERIREEGIEALLLSETCSPGSTEDLAETVTYAKERGAEWVITDGYHFTAHYQKGVKEAGLKLLAVDDHGYSENWHCDILLNQNLNAFRQDYSFTHHQTPLLGGKFALLRREFLRAKKAESESTPEKKVLVTFGGTDPDNATTLILKSLNHVSLHLRITVLVGGGNQHLKEITAAVKDCIHPVEVKKNITDMPSAYQACDFIIGAGGSSCYEWIYFKRPGAISIIADNQEPVYEELVKTGVYPLGDLRREVEQKVLGEKLEEALSQSQLSSLEVDGMGASRIAAHLDGGYYLRPAVESDCQRYYAWANDPEVRRQSLNTETIPYENHVQWFNKRLKSDAAYLYVLVNTEEERCGQIRLEKSEGKWFLSYSIAEEARGKGAGKILLHLGRGKYKDLGIKKIYAVAKKGNEVSHKALISGGFQEVNATEELKEYEMTL